METPHKSYKPSGNAINMLPEDLDLNLGKDKRKDTNPLARAMMKRRRGPHAGANVDEETLWTQRWALGSHIDTQDTQSTDNSDDDSDSGYTLP